MPHYLKLAIWPNPLVLDYGFPNTTLTLAAVGRGAAVLMVTLFATLYALWQRSPIGLLGLWFFLILAPTSSFVPIANEVAAERRVYLPLAAVSVLASWLIYRCFARIGSDHNTAAGPRVRGREILGTLVIVGVAVALGYRTVLRNAEHQDEIVVWRSSMLQCPKILGRTTIWACF